jgi:AcrR family transcriptional regulator
MSELPAHLSRGQQTRDNIMQHAVRIAVSEGLEALTIGRVAESAAIAKATVLGHYGTKEQLQLATLDVGAREFIQNVVLASAKEPDGIVRVRALVDRWVAETARAEGGCLFASVCAEFDARPGAVRDRIKEMMRAWLSALEMQLVQAKQLKHLVESADPMDLAFCLHGIQLSLNLRAQLFEERNAVTRGRAAMHAMLRGAATAVGKRLLGGGRKR